MAGYNPYLIVEAADALKKQAFFELVLGLVVGVVLGGCSGFVGPARAVSPAGAAIGAIIGLCVGYGRAFSLNMMAQLILCFAKIEQNTRPEDERQELAKQKEVASKN